MLFSSVKVRTYLILLYDDKASLHLTPVIFFLTEEFIPKAYASPLGIFKIGEFASDCMDKTCNLHKWRQLKPGQLHIAITNLPFFTADRYMIYFLYMRTILIFSFLS